VSQHRDALLVGGYVLDVCEVVVGALFDARKQKEALSVYRVHGVWLYVKPRVLRRALRVSLQPHSMSKDLGQKVGYVQ